MCLSQAAFGWTYSGSPSFAEFRRSLAPSPDAVVRPDGSILGVRPPQLPDGGNIKPSQGVATR